MTQEVEKITRHQDEYGTIFQVRHFVQNYKIHNVLNEIARVYRERKDDKGNDLPAVFCGGDPNKIMAMTELKSEAPVVEVAPEPVAEPAVVPAKGRLKAAPEPVLVPPEAPSA